MARSRDYTLLTQEHQDKIAWCEAHDTYRYRRSFGTPRRRSRWWLGNRRSRYHQWHKRLVSRRLRHDRDDCLDADGLALPPYNRRCVRWMDA